MMSREMKDSGVAWIGDIPKGWEIHKGKHVLAIQKRSIRETDDVITCFRDGEVVLRSERRTQGFTFSDKEIGYQGINKGDIVIHGMDGFAGAIGISKSTGKGSPVLIVCNPFQNDNSEYLVQYLHVLAQTNVFLALATGVRERSCDLRWNKITDLPFVIPPQSEQNLIMEFLNTKCAEIDNLISLLEEMIRELKAYKQSVITEAVCKGLNKNAPMKDSGIEWIGEIPRDWEICRLKNHIIFNPKHKNEKGLCNDDIVSFMPMECLRTGNIEPKSTTYQIAQAYTPFENDDIVMAKVTPCFENGNIAIAYDLLNGYGFGSSEIFVFRCNNELSNTFLYYYLQSNFAKAIGVSSMTGTGGLKRVNPTTMNNIQLLFPPLTEQQTIANYLDEKCGNIEGLIKIKQAKIDELKEFKKSLIYEYVIGKKSVI
ncbi:MAG: restriction endonuclease subunit S [Parabacteroides sp.]|nr:restriction endonuclease subunit S [Parabacteroides sp.]